MALCVRLPWNLNGSENFVPPVGGCVGEEGNEGAEVKKV